MNLEKGKNNKLKSKKIYVIAILCTCCIATIVGVTVWFNSSNKFSYASSSDNIEIKKYEEGNKTNIDIEEILNSNTKNVIKEEIYAEEIDLEYTTIYKNNSELPKGIIQVLQEGTDGKQQIIIKKTYEGDTLIKEEQIGNKVTKSSVDKIIEVGTAKYTSNYKVKKGDTLYVTSYTLNIMMEPNKDAKKVTRLVKDTEVQLLEINQNWYKIKYGDYSGWANADCLTYINPNKKYEEQESVIQSTKTKEQLLSQLSKDMKLNKPSGLTIEQFKKVLTGNEADTNKVFEQNAEYFYYIEKQYNINGIFVAAVGIHESAWGSSKISLDKKNLFGYGASDSSPYNNAYSFSSYSEGIDLIARVFTKYYINPTGTKIYDNQTATGRFYNGSTLSAINQKYATDKNWNEGVYKWMQYLYNRL